jgi:threonine/homoserine/homoserine lactone efflux protein
MGIAGSLASILAVLIVGVMSPGPSFLLVAQTAVGQSRRATMVMRTNAGTLYKLDLR